MKITYSNRNLFILAFFIFCSVNLVVLLGVLYNRSGKPDFEGCLTEREMNLPWKIHNENSGLSLQLMWRTSVNKSYDNYYSGSGSPAWFNAKKLKVLGFKIDTLINSKEYHHRYKKQLPKEVYIVLEYNGASYKNSLVIAENELIESEEKLQMNPEDKDAVSEFERAKENLEKEKHTKSKLFAIDAGLDQAQLRDRYSDRSKYIITKGIVRPRFYSKDNKNRVVGSITKLSVEKIHVPLKFKNKLEAFLNKNTTRNNDITLPRYKIELAYGKRLEPYIVTVKQSYTEQEKR